MHRRALAAAALAASLVCAGTARAQEVTAELRDSQNRLEQIRQERERLQQDMEQLRIRMEGATAELATIVRMRSASASALRELEFQATIVAAEVEETTRMLGETRERLAERSALLQQRLRWIYKQGPLHTVKVLLSAQSFTDLLNRYKYLQLIAAYDRTLVDDVVTLERDLARQEQLLTDHLSLLQRLAAEKAAEDAQLRQIETEQAQVIEAARQQERALADRLEQLARDEARISSLIDELEQRRLEAERRAAVAGAPAAAPGSISTSDLGALRWPVEGQLLYRFGTEVRPNGVRLRWNGIGIGAPVGTPVSAVGSGTVVMAAPLEGYGPSVVLDHGDGYYTLYLHLASIAVAEGQFVQGGQVLGTVGGERTAEGPHIEFRVHAPGPGGAPLPVDPLSWLQLRAEP